MTLRDELIEKLDAAYEDYRSAIDDLDERQFDRKWLDDGKWAAREITAHLTGWLGTLGGGLERMGRGEKPSPEGENWTEPEPYNATFADHARGKKHDQILHELESGMESFKKAAMTVPEERYVEGKTAHLMFEGAGIAHFKEHADVIREWRRREGI